MGWVHAPAVLLPRKRPGTHCTGCWMGPRIGLYGAPTDIRYPDRLARRESLCRLHYLGQRYDRVKVILKQTSTVLDRPLGFEEVEAPTISRQSAHEYGKVVNPRHRPPLSPIRYPWYSFLSETELTPGP